jgi:hypothetical protein
VLAKSGIDFLLPAQSDHQAKRLFHDLLLGRTPRSFSGLRHEGIINIDIGAHL